MISRRTFVLTLAAGTLLAERCRSWRSPAMPVPSACSYRQRRHIDLAEAKKRQQARSTGWNATMTAPSTSESWPAD